MKNVVLASAEDASLPIYEATEVADAAAFRRLIEAEAKDRDATHCMLYSLRGLSAEASRGDAAAADSPRRRVARLGVAATPWSQGRVAATPRPRRGYSAEASRGDVAAATRIFHER